MHTKTHTWGRCCERGVRVLRACEWLLVGVCVSATAKRVEFAGKKDGNERLRRAAFRRWTPMLQTCACGVALLTRPVGRGGAHGAFVSGPCSGTGATAHLLFYSSACCCCSHLNASYLQRQALTPRTIHYGHTRIRPIRRTRACSLVGMAARR